MHKNRVKAKLKAGQQVIGTFLKCSDAAVVEVLGHVGMDFVVIDNAHANLDRETTLNLIRTAEVAGLTPIVRVSRNDPEEILHALDAGALGVQVPQVNSAEEARQAVASCKYYPVGERGFAASPRANLYGLDDPIQYARKANQETMVITYVETKQAVEAVESMLAVPNVDVLFMGPFDLSQSYGHLGQVRHPDVINAMQSVIDAARGSGVAVGTIAGTPEAAQEWLDQGVSFLVYSSDLGLMAAAAANTLKQIKRR